MLTECKKFLENVREMLSAQEQINVLFSERVIAGDTIFNNYSN